MSKSKRAGSAETEAGGGGLTRRQAVGLTAGAAVALAANERWVFAARGGEVVKTASTESSEWRPVLLDEREGRALARLVEALIPRTETPGARDARVHEYIDLAVSLSPGRAKKSFVDGLRWLDRQCQRRHGADLVDAAQSDLVELLRSVSDEHPTHPRDLEPGARFFADLKRRTIFGYYTSLEGRVEELGLAEVVTLQKWQGCPHPEGADHS